MAKQKKKAAVKVKKAKPAKIIRQKKPIAKIAKKKEKHCRTASRKDKDSKVEKLINLSKARKAAMPAKKGFFARLFGK